MYIITTVYHQKKGPPTYFKRFERICRNLLISAKPGKFFFVLTTRMLLWLKKMRKAEENIARSQKAALSASHRLLRYQDVQTMRTV